MCLPAQGWRGAKEGVHQSLFPFNKPHRKMTFLEQHSTSPAGCVLPHFFDALAHRHEQAMLVPKPNSAVSLQFVYKLQLFPIFLDTFVTKRARAPGFDSTDSWEDHPSPQWEANSDQPSYMARHRPPQDVLGMAPVARFLLPSIFCFQLSLHRQAILIWIFSFI